ncbi:MAG: hypothetical protein VX641_00145 [Planctomycetota bacterium]|nr:hypothetical protein [Planctomycetota bacterium]
MSDVNTRLSNIFYKSVIRYTATPSTLVRPTGANLTHLGLTRRLRSHLPHLSHQERDELVDRAMRRTYDVVEDDRSWQVPVPSRMHLEWASSVLAGYQVIRELTGDPVKTMEIMDDATRNVGRPERPMTIVRGLERAFYNEHGAMRNQRIRQWIVNSMRHYDTPWEWYVRDSDARRAVVSNANCFYFHFFGKYGELPLAGIFYRLHKEVFKGIERSRKIGFDHAASRSQYNGDSDNVFILTKLQPSSIDAHYVG